MKKALVLKGFTLVELLVVITILAIISVVAYQNFGGAVDKAVSGRKINDVSTIETALQQYKVDNNFYPPTDIYNAASNVWGYDSTQNATPSNIIRVTYNGQEVATVLTGSSIGGGKVFGIGAFATKQIGAKGTISQATLGKKYLTKDLYDPEIGDVKVTTPSKKMIDYGIGRYVYSTYKKAPDATNWTQNYNGAGYNIAFTIKQEGGDTYATKIVGDYDAESCFADSAKCPANLFVSLTDGATQSGATSATDYEIPYGVTDLAQ